MRKNPNYIFLAKVQEFFFFFWFVTFSTLVVRKTFWRYTTIKPLKLQINSSSSGGHRLIHEVKSLIPLVGIAWLI